MHRTTNLLYCLGLFISILLGIMPVFSQPHLKGDIHIDMDQGIFKCTFTLSNIPEVSDYKILLHKGMNIKFFKDEDGKLLSYDGYFEGGVVGEASEYTFVDDKDAPLPIPSSFYIEYIGAFPVYKGSEKNSFDYQGHIAFNEKTMRAAELSEWYPVIYDSDKEQMINSYSYEISISVNRESSIFINGSTPQKGSKADFLSKVPQRLLLFIGDYEFISNNGNHLLNMNLQPEVADKIIKELDIIKGILAENLGTEFTDHTFLMSHDAIYPNNGGQVWGFNSYPTIAFSGVDFGMLLEQFGQLPEMIYELFGHEFGHNYFGYNVQKGVLANFWTESFAEFTSFYVVEKTCGADYLKQDLAYMASTIKKESFIPLDQIAEEDEVSESYRYTMGPLILKCFEDTFGREKTNQMIQNLLASAEEAPLTLKVWRADALKSGIQEGEFDEFFQHFVSHENFKDHVLGFIGERYK